MLYYADDVCFTNVEKASLTMPSVSKYPQDNAFSVVRRILHGPLITKRDPFHEHANCSNFEKLNARLLHLLEPASSAEPSTVNAEFY